MVDNPEKIYKRLRKHLNRQTIGYPAVRSGADLRLLRYFFTPDEAQVALNLGHVPASAEKLFGDTPGIDHTKRMLETMARRCVIGCVEKQGEKCFFLIPLVVGMYEGQANRLTPRFLEEFDAYTATRAFGLSFLATKLPQMRTIPIGKSISPTHCVADYDQLADLLNASDGPFVINHCICMQAAEVRGNKCTKTDRTERCLAIGDTAGMLINAGKGRQIEKSEALSISRQNEADGLILQPNNARKAEFICACCGCCCGMLAIHKRLPRPMDFWVSNFHAIVDPDGCTGCGICTGRCEVDAVVVAESTHIAIVDQERCLGCGHCVAACPEEAIYLTKKNIETVPPVTAEALNQTNMANKKGMFGKFKLAVQLRKVRKAL